ncbi:MAG: hypothetical protein H0W86_09635 [Armatimonadetes bacterium]|nr:hypothetical protein [Armatimonadota bacterium]
MYSCKGRVGFTLSGESKPRGGILSFTGIGKQRDNFEAAAHSSLGYETPVGFETFNAEDRWP